MMCIMHAQNKYSSCILKEETVCKRAVMVERPEPILVSFSGPTVHTATLNAIRKIIMCSLRFGMMWSIKMVQLFGKGCLRRFPYMLRSRETNFNSSKRT